MINLFPSKKRGAQPRIDLSLEHSAQTANDAKEPDGEATSANAKPRVGAETRRLKRLGVDIIHEPSEPTAAVVE